MSLIVLLIGKRSIGSFRPKGGKSHLPHPNARYCSLMNGCIQLASTFYNVPPFQVPQFILRNALLARLNQGFERASTSSTPLTVVLFGMGGAGKTQLALQYCQHAKECGKYRGIFWLDASSLHAINRAMETIAKNLMPGRVLDDEGAAVAAVKDTLAGWKDPWLLVFDNLDSPSDLNTIPNFIPHSQIGSVLVTSRLAGAQELGQGVELDCMEKAAASSLLSGYRSRRA